MVVPVATLRRSRLLPVLVALAYAYVLWRWR